MQPKRAPPEAASSLSPMLRELLQNQPAPFHNQAAPLSGSSPETASSLALAGAAPRSRSPSKKSALLHNRAAPRSRSPPKKSALLHNRAAPCSGSSPRSSLLTASLAQSSSPIHSRSARPPPPPPPPSQKQTPPSSKLRATPENSEGGRGPRPRPWMPCKHVTFSVGFCQT